MGIRASAASAEAAALTLAQRGRGLFGHRERQTEQVIGKFVGAALSMPPGGVLPHEIREALRTQIDRTIESLELYVSRNGERSRRRALHDTGVVKLVYALREAQQQLLQTAHFRPIPASNYRSPPRV